MAWSSVRTLIEGWLNASTVKFYNTVNEEAEPAEDLWMTVLYGFSNSSILSFCRSRLEENNFTVVLYGNPGLGWKPVITAAEQVKDHIMAQSDPAGKVQVLDYTAPVEFTAGDGSPWYGVEMVFTYQKYD